MKQSLAVMIAAFLFGSTCLAQSKTSTEEQQRGKSAATRKRPIKWHEVEAKYPTGIAFSPDGRLLAATSRKKVQVWSLPEKKLVHEFATENHTHAPSFGPDSATIMVADGVGNLEYKSTFRVFSLTTGNEKKSVGSCMGVVHDVTFSQNHKTMAAVSSYGAIGVVVARGEVGFDACGEIVIFSDAGVKKIYCELSEPLDRDPQKAQQAIVRDLPMHLAMNPEGTRLAAASGNGRLRLFDVQTGKQLMVLKGGGPMRFTKDGHLQSAEFTYDANGKVLRQQAVTTWRSLSGNFAATQAKSGQVAVRDITNPGQPVWLSAAKSQPKSMLAVTADGRHAAVADLEKITIWRIDRP